VKKALSILGVMLTVASAANISVARHYCHGVQVATRVSLSGDHASCGMEESDNSCPMGGHSLSSHCCDDKVSVYGIDNTCINSVYSAPEVTKIRNLIPPVIAHTLLSDLCLPVSEYADTGPPSSVSIPAVDLPVICQFRL